MAPKKKGKAGKKDAKKDAGDGDGELNPQELLRRAAFRIESLERQLAWREEKMAAALASQRELKERVALYHEDFEREKASIFDIASDMTRQYKGMQARAAAAAQHTQAGPVCSRWVVLSVRASARGTRWCVARRPDDCLAPPARSRHRRTCCRGSTHWRRACRSRRTRLSCRG